MKTAIRMGLSMASACAVLSAAVSEAIPPDLSKYVCTNRFFDMPESVDPLNVDHVRLLTLANPDRFESHLMLALALSKKGEIDKALSEFEIVDALSAHVPDTSVLAGLDYEASYALMLFAHALQKANTRTNDVQTLRMMQQVAGMDTSMLKKEKWLSRCYLVMASIYLKRGSFDAALHASQEGKQMARDEANEKNQRLFDEIIQRANALKSDKQKMKTPNKAPEGTAHKLADPQH